MREREREASWGIFGGFSEYAEALGNSQLGKFSLFISQSLNFFFFLSNYWVKDLFLWLKVWFFIQIQLGMTLFRFFFLIKKIYKYCQNNVILAVLTAMVDGSLMEVWIEEFWNLDDWNKWI